jgi:hypothetical protein
MKKTGFLVLSFCLFIKLQSQVRNVNKLTLESCYTYSEIRKPLSDLVDASDKSSYFDDDFFNSFLKKIITDKQYSDKEKVQVFYLMQKKLGYAFVGVAYLPPRQSYFDFHLGQVMTWQKTKASLKDLNYDPSALLTLVDSNRVHDAILASNALLLATLLNTDSVIKKLEFYSSSETIMRSKNPGIFNHCVCLCASLLQNEHIVNNLVFNLANFRQREAIEDVLCALYSKNNPVSSIKDYILSEKDPKNALCIETALCALAERVPEATFQKSVKGFISESKDKWKTDLCKNILAKKIPYNYTLSSKDQVVSKAWGTVQINVYAEGFLISNGLMLEFDPN